VLLDPQGFSPAASGDFHLPHRVLDTPVVSWMAVEPSGMVLPSTLGSRGSRWGLCPNRASVSGALSIIASRGLSIPRSSRDYHLIIKIDRDLDAYELKPRQQTNIKAPTTMKKDTALCSPELLNIMGKD